MSRTLTRSRRRTGIALAAYLAMLTIAELLVTFGSPVLVFPLHAGLIVLIIGYISVAWARVEPTRGETGLVLALVLGPLIRLISLTLPLGQIDTPYRYLAAGLPMMIGGFVAARYAGVTWTTLGLTWRDTPWQLLVIAAAVPIGFFEFILLRPEPVGALPWEAAGLIPAMTLGFFTGFPEELIFRGLMQTVTRPFLGRWNWVYVAAVFAVLHIGYRSYLDVVFVFGAGLLFGWVFERTRSIVGISVSHGLANIVLFFVAPNLLASEAMPEFGTPVQAAAAIVTVIVIAVIGYRVTQTAMRSSYRAAGQRHTGAS